MKYFINVNTLEDVKVLYKTLCKKLHPDVGGSASSFSAMKEEYDAILKDPTILITKRYQSVFEKVHTDRERDNRAAHTYEKQRRGFTAGESKKRAEQAGWDIHDAVKQREDNYIKSWLSTEQGKFIQKEVDNVKRNVISLSKFYERLFCLEKLEIHHFRIVRLLFSGRPGSEYSYFAKYKDYKTGVKREMFNF